jgi:hypothetical protein
MESEDTPEIEELYALCALIVAGAFFPSMSATRPYDSHGWVNFDAPLTYAPDTEEEVG